MKSCKENKETLVSEKADIHQSSATASTEDEDVFAVHENENSKEKSSVQDPAKEWLETLFKCAYGNKFCFYLETEEKETTKRFYQFMIDSEKIFGANNLTEEDLPLAKKKYQQKSSTIYPLRKEIEPWIFGRGQDDMEDIKNVKIEKISDLEISGFCEL